MNTFVKLVRLTAFLVWLILRVVEAVLTAAVVTLAWLLAPKAMLAIRLTRPVKTLRRHYRISLMGPTLPAGPDPIRRSTT
jgi:hypothetical protein